jgi:two-component system alkaline phosphatase synthesis response regulator PhoP
MSRTVLVADDEPNLRSLLKKYLMQQGYQVVTARDGEEALVAARDHHPDVIVLDIMMPKMDGLEFIRRFRKEAQVPIILLTARVEDSDIINGLDIGADDYVTKPFSPRELSARIGVMLRRVARSGSPNVLRGGGIILDRRCRLVLVDDREVALTPTEFDLLAVLMSAPGRVFSRLDLLDVTQGRRFEGIERTVDVHIKNLRSKIEADPRHPVRVQTIYGIGYRFARD